MILSTQVDQARETLGERVCSLPERVFPVFNVEGVCICMNILVNYLIYDYQVTDKPIDKHSSCE